MLSSFASKLRYGLLGAAAAALVLITTTALAGSGVGGVLNLGQVNTVDAQTTLSGNPGGSPELKVVNAGSAAAISAETNSTDPNGAGLVGKNTGGGAGLKAIVNAGAPPLVVNSGVRVLNLNADMLDGLDSTGFWRLGGNAGTAPGVDFLGTTDNKALEVKVNGQRALRLEPATRSNAPKSPNLIGGFSGNGVSAGAVGATISGGGRDANANLVSDDDGTVGGGIANVAGDEDAGGNPTSAPYTTVGGGAGNAATSPYSTIAGGQDNTAAGAFAAFVGGGRGNTALQDAVVPGGYHNTAGGPFTTVSGGYHNTASGNSSTVAGGIENTASGDLSFAAGTYAKATQSGSFVWGDETFGNLTSPAPNTFTIRASGGIWLGTTSAPAITAGHFIDTSTGAYLSSAGAWTDNSSRTLKHDFRPVDRASVLQKVAGLPISRWSYKAEKPAVRHIGPTAQDFYKAFGLGLDNKHITTIDEGGVALAAIQGLYRQNQALERQNRLLNARLSRLEGVVAKLTR